MTTPAKGEPVRRDARADRPLPDLAAPGAWRGVQIAPVDEPLVRVADLGGRLVDDPRYHAMGLPGTLPHNLVRAGVGARLRRVADGLPAGLSLVVWDGWRSLETQTALFDAWAAEIRGAHPEWDDETVDRETARYVSVPSRDALCPAPHITGGAVDVSLGDDDGRPVDLGTSFDAFVAEAGAAALESVPGAARDNRRLLFWAMAEQGFTAYVEEWWHFDFGDQFWGSITGQPARYGPTAPAS